MPSPPVFADTFYWVAVLSPRDPFHARVMAWGRTHGATRLITTDEVLTEVLNWFSGGGPYWRGKAVTFVHNLRSDPDVDVLPQSRTDFDAALALYEARPDKEYSLTDFRSMLALRSLGISEVLTNDHHFAQEGYVVLFRRLGRVRRRRGSRHAACLEVRSRPRRHDPITEEGQIQRVTRRSLRVIHQTEDETIRGRDAGQILS